MQIILAIITAGIPGVLSYWYLKQIGILNHSVDSKDDKVMVITSLSFFNIITSLLVFAGLAVGWKGYSYKQIEQHFILSIFILLIISVLVTMILTVILYPNLIKLGRFLVNKRAKQENAPYRSPYSGIEMLLRHEDKEVNHYFVYIYNLENKFIEAGWYELLNSKNRELILVGDTGYKKEHPFKSVIQEYNHCTNNRVDQKMLIDLQNKIKIICFYYK